MGEYKNDLGCYKSTKYVLNCHHLDYLLNFQRRTILFLIPLYMVNICVNAVGASCHYIKLHFEKTPSKEKLIILSDVYQLTHMLKTGKASCFPPLYEIFTFLTFDLSTPFSFQTQIAQVLAT